MQLLDRAGESDLFLQAVFEDGTRYLLVEVILNPEGLYEVWADNVHILTTVRVSRAVKTFVGASHTLLGRHKLVATTPDMGWI